MQGDALFHVDIRGHGLLRTAEGGASETAWFEIVSEKRLSTEPTTVRSDLPCVHVRIFTANLVISDHPVFNISQLAALASALGFVQEIVEVENM